MKLFVTTPLRVRRQANRRFPPLITLPVGVAVEVLPTVVIGERVEGNNRWFQGVDGRFYWSGGLTKAPEAAQPSPGVAAAAAWWLQTLGVERVWAAGRGRGVRVAVLDTGADVSHPALVTAVAARWNAMENTENVADFDGHGTHCAGIIGARPGGLALGLAHECQLYIAKIMNFALDGFEDASLVKAIDWAIAKQVHVISVSAGTPLDVPEIRRAVQRASNQGITLVSAIGNGGGKTADAGRFPARYAECLSVGAIDEALNLTDYTDQSPQLLLSAPGQNVLSTYPNHEYRVLNGTSMATAYVAGLVAALKSAQPSASAATLRDCLTQTALAKTTGSYSYHVVQPPSALAHLKQPFV